MRSPTSAASPEALLSRCDVLHDPRVTGLLYTLTTGRLAASDVTIIHEVAEGLDGPGLFAFWCALMEAAQWADSGPAGPPEGSPTAANASDIGRALGRSLLDAVRCVTDREARLLSKVSRARARDALSGLHSSQEAAS